ncbi:MAG TPA: DUF1761 domain-containing protein [Planctomycetota bacterium]
MGDVNLPAVIVAAVSSFLLGGLWYSPVMFLKPWMKAAGITEKQDGHPGKVFGVSFVFTLIAAWLMGYILGPAPEMAHALERGLLFGAGFVATSMGTNYLFSNRSMALWLIDGGYHLVQFLLFGVAFSLFG